MRRARAVVGRVARIGVTFVLVVVAINALAAPWLVARGTAQESPTFAPGMSPVATSTVGTASLPDAGDPRSDGQGPGVVGEPLLVLVGILIIGVATVVVTVVVARLSGRA